MDQYVVVKDLPAVVQTALEQVGYRKADVRVQVATEVSLSSAGGNGFRAYTCLVDLSTNRYTVEWGSWGGPNMFNPGNPVDNDTRTYTLPGNGVAITGRAGGSVPVSATVHVPASMTDRMLPGPKVELAVVERDALYCHHLIKGGAYRRAELQRRRVPASVVGALVERGLLRRNRAGAVSITTAGKNALGGYRGH